jgi:hypothetical protein
MACRGRESQPFTALLGPCLEALSANFRESAIGNTRASDIRPPSFVLECTTTCKYFRPNCPHSHTVCSTRRLHYWLVCPTANATVAQSSRQKPPARASAGNRPSTPSKGAGSVLRWTVPQSLPKENSGFSPAAPEACLSTAPPILHRRLAANPL